MKFHLLFFNFGHFEGIHFQNSYDLFFLSASQVQSIVLYVGGGGSTSSHPLIGMPMPMNNECLGRIPMNSITNFIQTNRLLIDVG